MSEKLSDSKQLIEYCKNNDYNSAKELCYKYQDAKMTVAFSTSAYSCKALQHAIKHDNKKIINLLIEHPTFVALYNEAYSAILKNVAKKDDWILFKILFEAKAYTKTGARISDAVYYSSMYNSIRVFKYIVHDYGITDLYEAFKTACKYESNDIIDFILARNLSVKTIQRYLSFLYYSERSFYKKIEKRILEKLKLKSNPTKLPKDLYIYAISNAIYTNDVEYYRKLRQHPDFITSVRDNIILMYNNYSAKIHHVVQNNHVEIMQEFLKDPALKNRIDLYRVITELIKLNNIDFINSILKTFDVNNVVYSNMLKTALKYENTDVVKMILNTDAFTEIHGISVIINSSLKSVETFLYIMNNKKVLKTLSNLPFNKIPTSIKAYLISKFDIKTTKDFKRVIQML